MHRYVSCLNETAGFKSWNQSTILKSDSLKDYFCFGLFALLSLAKNYVLSFKFLLNSSSGTKKGKDPEVR